MKKSITALMFITGLFFSNISFAAHCSGGHKEVKDETETTTSEPTEEVKN